MNRTFRRPEYDDEDLFADSRMSLGEHLEELRLHLWRAVVGLIVFALIGFALDALGTATGWPVGIGKPVMEWIKAPVERQMQEFYGDRVWEVLTALDPPPEPPDWTTQFSNPELWAEYSRLNAEYQERKRLEREEFNAIRRASQLGQPPIADLKQPREILLEIDAAQLRKQLADKEAGKLLLNVRLSPLQLAVTLNNSQMALGKRMNLTTLSAQEAFVVYFKVTLVCGFVLASPWIFLQIWMFVAKGLYPHEKRYVHTYLPFSIGLFLGGVIVCQFIVMPKAVAALLSFNAWLGLDPDLRLNEWLSFALLLPLVFGISFQTPLVMMFLARIGVFTADDYARQWRIALFSLAVISAVFTPTPDPITMLLLLAPLFGLYALGILLCRYAARDTVDVDAPLEKEIAV